jgi:methionyl-tRNA formyltransferase
MGSDPIALPLLEWLAGEGSAEIIAVYTQPDRPTGRGQKVVANAIKNWALAQGIPVHQPAKLNREERETYATLAPDLALVMAYGHILSEAFIAIPRLGTVNLHASILPDYRGASPIQSAVCSGDTETGISLMRIVRELDAGPVGDVERVSIDPADTALEVETKLSKACVPLVSRNLAAIATGKLSFTEQEHTRATYCRKLTKADGVLDFAQPAGELAARINGLHPWPGVRVEIGGQLVRLGGASSSEQSTDAAPGAVLDTGSETLAVATGQGTLQLTQLQRPGGRMLPTTDFLRGFPIAPGTVLPSAPMPTLVTQSKF